MQTEDNKRNLRILLLEDDLCDIELFRIEAAKRNVPCVITTVATREEFEAELSKSVPDLILSDSSLPGFTGLSALALVRAKHATVPFILFSGSIPEEVKAKALALGATDCLLKGNFSKIIAIIQRLSAALR